MSIPDRKTNDFVFKLINIQWIWIGATRKALNRKEFSWRDGTAWSSWSAWHRKQPDDRNKGREDCVVYNRKGWHDATCEPLKNHFVCQKPTSGKNSKLIRKSYFHPNLCRTILVESNSLKLEFKLLLCNPRFLLDS